MAILTGDRYLNHLVRFVDRNAGQLLDGTLTLKLNPIGLHYVQSRLESLREIETLVAVAPVDYLRSYVSDLGDHRALEQLRRILRLLTSLRVVSSFGNGKRDPAPLSLMPFASLKVLELRGCDLSRSEAKGLLELRHTLERLICHNSTDALRHVFSSRIVDIKDSPVWKRLTFVSCSCNNLVLMDESLQLLPAVETLDLSWNRFTKADNLRKCMKLRHLDLGFNQLRSISMLSEASSRIINLSLRNNALTKLQGIENLKSLVGLDLSYNIISNFSELEILARLSSLDSLWLEGNPICYASWYRAHIFSFFSNPQKLKLDEKFISTREYWERHVIFLNRQKKPSGFGFYFPAKDDPDDLGSPSSKNRKRNLRVACIEEEQSELLNDEDAPERDPTLPHDSDGNNNNLSKEENNTNNNNNNNNNNTISDSESEVIRLINQAEYMKRERSVLWLKEFNEWMDQSQYEPPKSRSKSNQKLKKRSKSFDKDSSRSEQSSENSVSLSVSENGTVLVEIGTINEISVPDSPPQYKEEVLHRRFYSDELLQLSTVSQSDSSSESGDHSSDDNALCELYASSSEDDTLILERNNGKFGILNGNDFGEKVGDFKFKRKVSRRAIPFSEDQNGIIEFDEDSDTSSSNSCSSRSLVSDRERKEGIRVIFQTKIADSKASETCEEVICCECIFLEGLDYTQSEVALLRSSKNKIYLLIMEVTPDGQETVSRVLGDFMLQDVKRFVFGLGLQLLRVYMVGETTYLFIASTMEKAQDILSLLQISGLPHSSNDLSLQSWEWVQVKLLEREILCGDLEMGILLYSMLLFWKDDQYGKGGSWERRSLFVIGEYIILCNENLVQFASFSDNMLTSSPTSSSPYFSLDSCRSIQNLLELVIDLRDNKCLTLILDDDHTYNDQCFIKKNVMEREKENDENIVKIQKWKLKWFSQDSLPKFVSLLKAIHWSIADSPLPVHCMS